MHLCTSPSVSLVVCLLSVIDFSDHLAVSFIVCCIVSSAALSSPGLFFDFVMQIMEVLLLTYLIQILVLCMIALTLIMYQGTHLQCYVVICP